MSDEVLSLSSSEEGRNSPCKKAKKRKSADSSFNDNQKKENSPKKKLKIQTESLDKNENEKKVVKPKLVAEITPSTSNVDGSFQSFMKICLERRSDCNTKKILGKLQKLYNKLSSCHKSDDKFKSYVDACLEKITKNLSKDIYTPILELRSEIKNRIQSKLEDESTSDTGVEVEEMSKDKKRQIEQVEEAIKKCQLKIKELQEKEVDFDEDQDSAYIQEDKYKKKIIQLCKLLSELTGDTEMRKQIFKKKIRREDVPGEMTGNLFLDEAVISLVNSHIGKINKFKYLETEACADLIKMPDYIDVLRCIQKSDKNSNLDLGEEKLTKLAKRAFKDLGNFLKNKRINDTEWYLQSLIPVTSQDLAEKDVELQRKLQNNKTEGDKRLEAIYKKYLDKQDGVYEEEEESEEQTDGEESFEDENQNKDDKHHSDEKNENNKHEKENSNRKEKEILETNKIAKTSFIHVHQILKSKEKLKNGSNTDTTIKNKEISKDNTGTKAITKSEEAVKKKTTTETTLTSKEAMKDDTKTASEFQDTVKSNKKATSKSQETVKENSAMEPARTSKEAVKHNAKAASNTQEPIKKNIVTEPVITPKESVKGNTEIKAALKSKETFKDSVIMYKETLKDNTITKATSNTQEPIKKNTPKEAVKDNTIAETALKSRETLKNNTDTNETIKCKETLKDNIVSNATSKSGEALKKNTEQALTSKEATKNNTFIEVPQKAEETLKNNTVKEATLGCSKTGMMNEKRENFKKTIQIDYKDDDVITIDSSDDECTEVEKPLKKIVENKFFSTEPKIVTVDVDTSFQSASRSITSTPMRTVQQNISPKKLVDLTKVDNSEIKISFVKVREFAKSPPAWVDDESIVQSPWLSD